MNKILFVSVSLHYEKNLWRCSWFLCYQHRNNAYRANRKHLFVNLGSMMGSFTSKIWIINSRIKFNWSVRLVRALEVACTHETEGSSLSTSFVFVLVRPKAVRCPSHFCLYWDWRPVAEMPLGLYTMCTSYAHTPMTPTFKIKILFVWIILSPFWETSVFS